MEAIKYLKMSENLLDLANITNINFDSNCISEYLGPGRFWSVSLQKWQTWHLLLYVPFIVKASIFQNQTFL